MSDLYKEQIVTSRDIAGRECDNCGNIEMSDRSAITFRHKSDHKWVRVQISLDDYTQPENNKEFDLCSSKCYKEFALEKASIWKHEKDCLGGIPLRYLEELLNG